MIINRPFLWGLIFVCCCFVLSSCEEKAKPFRNETYQTLDGNLKIKIYSKDELEYKESSTPNIVAKYTIEEGDKLRVVIQFLGTTQAMYYKIVQEGLKAGDGTILYSTKYYEKERKRRELAKKRAQEKKENEARLARLKIERETNLAKAALGGDVATVNDLLGEGVNPNAVARVRGSEIKPLLVASREGHTKIVKLLLKKGANPNTEDFNYTALIYASRNGHTEIVKALLDKGAKVNKRDRFKNSALIEAVKRGYTEIVKLLLEKGADPNDGKDSPVLVRAAYKGCTEIVRALLSNGAHPDGRQQSGDGETALMNAAKNGHYEIVKLLLENGANANLKTHWSKRTALWYAHNHPKIIKLLKEVSVKKKSTKLHLKNTDIISSTEKSQQIKS